MNHSTQIKANKVSHAVSQIQNGLTLTLRLGLATSLAWVNYNGYAQDQLSCGTQSTWDGPIEGRGVNCSNTGDDWINTYRRPAHWTPASDTPPKTVLVNFVICRNSFGLNGWQDSQFIRDQFELMIDGVNLWYASPGTKGYPSTCEPLILPVLDSKIRFELNEIYFLDNTAFNEAHTYSALYDIIDYMEVEHPESLGAMNHIFVQPPPPFDTWSGNYWGEYVPYHQPHAFVWTRSAMGWPDPATWTDLINHISHEYGHAVGLHHITSAEHVQLAHYDFLDDVFGQCPEADLIDPSHPCFNCTPPAGYACHLTGCFLGQYPVTLPLNPGDPCHPFMSGGPHSFYLSPKQAGRMHRALSLFNNSFIVDNRPMHKYVKEEYSFGVPYTVSSSETWDFAIKMYQDIVVEAPATLTLQCEVRMPVAGRIIVKPGAKLVVDGGVVTSAHDGEFWSGIEVWGDNAHHQWPTSQPTYQGMLVLKNDAVIEHARNITMQQPGTYWTFGGVIQATDATFLNCRRSTEFLSYQNTTPGGTPISNRSFFRRCDFIVDENYRGADDFYAHVSMWGVDGVTFRACNFENRQNDNVLAITQSAKLGFGIVSEDASYRVLGVCATNPPWPGDVCPAYIPTTFKGLDHGINARNFSTARNFIVDRCRFEDNVCGVYANSVVGFQVKNSRFLVGGNEVPDLTNTDEEFWGERHRGVFSTESWAFAIDDNDLEQSGDHEFTEGVVVGYSYDHNDVVFRNEATGLERAYIGEGICADLSSSYAAIRGLWFLCNENENNPTNFWARKVTEDEINDPNDHTIRLNQGMPLRPADNSFDQWPAGSANFDFRVTTTHSPMFYWHRPDAPFVPTNYTSGPYGINPIEAAYIPANNCANKVLLTIPPDPDSPSGMDPGPVTDYLLNKKLAYGNTRYLYEQLIDDGNTDEVVQEIQESWPQDAWALRDYLLARSPYLSTEALQSMVLRDVLPDAMVTEILVANPVATRSDGFLTWLQERSGHPLPEYLLGMVVASWDQRGYRDALEAEMTLHHAEMTQAANLLIHHYYTLPLTEDDLTSVPMDDVLWVWQQLRTPAARYAEALIWLELDNYAQATTVIESIPIEHKLRTPESLERQRMLDLIAFLETLQGTGRSEMQLSTAELATLQAMMGQAYDRPASWISNLLCFGYQHCRPPLTGGEEDGVPKSLPYTPLPAKDIAVQAALSIYPNPANSWVAFDYDLLVEPTNAAIVILDLTGREVYRIVLNESQQQKVWDTRQAAPGSYTVVLLNNRQQLRTEKLIIRQ